MQHVELKNRQKQVLAIAMFDSQMQDTMRQSSWRLAVRGRKRYCVGKVKMADGKTRDVYMHQLIMGPPPAGHCIDHIDGNGLNNIRANLRFVTYSVNAQNKTTSNDQGIRPYRKKWTVFVCGQYVGLYKTRNEAAVAYDLHALARYGSDAKVHFATSRERLEDIALIRQQIVDAPHEQRLMFGPATRDEKGIYLLVTDKEGKIKCYVDEEDWHAVAAYAWHLNESGYPTCLMGSKRVWLHQFVIAGTPVGKGQCIDHIDHDKMNCCKANLRIVSRAINSHNRQKTSAKSTSQYIGVSQQSRGGKNFYARLHFDGKCLLLGTFALALDAAAAYNKKALEMYGNCAKLNHIPKNHVITSQLFRKSARAPT